MVRDNIVQFTGDPHALIADRSLRLTTLALFQLPCPFLERSAPVIRSSNGITEQPGGGVEHRIDQEGEQDQQKNASFKFVWSTIERQKKARNKRTNDAKCTDECAEPPTMNTN